MLLVSKMYSEDSKDLVVSNDAVVYGYYIADNNDFFTDAEPSVFQEYRYKVETEEFIGSYKDYLEELDIKYERFPFECYVSTEEFEKTTKEWKYYYNSFSDEILKSDDNYYNEIIYLEYWDGHNWVREELGTCIEELESIETDIGGYEQHKVGQYDLYKKEDGTLLLVYSSYYQGSLDYVECDITEEELFERFEYKLA